MKAVFKACLLALLLLLPAASTLAHAQSLPAPLLSDPKYSYLASQTINNFTLMYNPEKIGSGDLAQARELAQRADDRVNDFFKFSGAELFKGIRFKTTVAIAADNAEFRLLVNVGNAPDGAKAVNWNAGINGLVAIKSPAMLPDFGPVLTHQMARIAERTRLNDHYGLPEWYQDGLASYVASDIPQDQRYAVVNTAAVDAWTPPDALEKAYGNMTIYNMDEPGNQLARAHAAMLVEHIGTLYGNASLVGIVDDFSVWGDFNRSFVNRTGFTPDALDREFRDSLFNEARATVVPSGNGTVEGYLWNTEGMAVAGAKLAFTRQNVTVTVTTDAAGRYRAELAQGQYQITSPGYPQLDGGPVLVMAGARVSQNVTARAPQATAGTTPTIVPGLTFNDLITYGLIVAGNVIAFAILAVILRRNWH